MIYADTSLLLPAYVAEARSGDADEILASARTIWISDLVVAEFHVSLARKLKLGTLRPEHGPVIRETFALHLEDGILHRASLQPRHMEVAGDLANRSPVILRTLDALHLAVAVERQLAVATFDQRMIDAARALGMQVVSEPPEDSSSDVDAGPEA